MKSFKGYLVEATFKNAKSFEFIDYLLGSIKAKDRNTYIDMLNTMSFKELQNIENSAESEANKYMNDTYKAATYSEKKELKIAINAFDAAVSEVFFK
jgi:hypothetical protein